MSLSISTRYDTQEPLHNRSATIRVPRRFLVSFSRPIYRRYLESQINPLSWIVFRVRSERKKIVALFSTDSARDLESRGFASQLRSSWIAFFRFLRAFLCGSCWKANIFSRNSSRGRSCSTKLVPCKHEFPAGILDSSYGPLNLDRGRMRRNWNSHSRHLGIFEVFSRLSILDARSQHSCTIVKYPCAIVTSLEINRQW